MTASHAETATFQPATPIPAPRASHTEAAPWPTFPAASNATGAAASMHAVSAAAVD
ncbi:hypothetical protein EWM64_g4893 [Hericium alpestre]|uniref:Uncharacterized protein n=1 Tax=Hericium alpestre TaxID=135208 RepID=A0A4Y9ZY48_9AGAM|nr:hypothetical protein EWM64_g4893 [Hericium alpestre]